MSSDDLRLNSLDRFRKSKSGLTLEVYSSCEVPAGCGGAVLRWRRVGAPILVWFSAYVDGTVVGLFLDGEPLSVQRRMVQPGSHVLSFIVDEPGNDGIFLFRMTLSPSLKTLKRPRFVSGIDGNWRATMNAPPDDWRMPGFDDSQFVPLVEREVPEPAGGSRWRWEVLTKEARGLGLPLPGLAVPETSVWHKWLDSDPHTRRVWVRCTFGLNDEGFA